MARVQRAFPFFELTIIVALGLIGWVAFGLYEIRPEADDSRKQLGELRSEYFRIADVVETTIKELNVSFTNFLASKEEAERSRFQLKSQQFRQWLEKENQR